MSCSQNSIEHVGKLAEEPAGKGKVIEACPCATRGFRGYPGSHLIPAGLEEKRRRQTAEVLRAILERVLYQV